jgi:hypothetical protein
VADPVDDDISNESTPLARTQVAEGDFLFSSEFCKKPARKCVLAGRDLAAAKDAILARFTRCNSGGPMAGDDMKAELERLRAENERLKSRQTRGVSLKVSEKGGVSVYGLGRFPVTLYKEQWTRLLEMADDIRAFIKENESKLKAKSE